MNRLTMNRLTMNRLSTAALSSEGISDAVSELIVDAPGRELLTYIARCALSSGEVLTVKYGSETYTFPGSIGLAPLWLEAPLLNPSTQRWISACLLAHVNGYGVQVPISLRGAHPALFVTWDEMVEYSVQEAAFFGNVFDTSTESDFDVWDDDSDDETEDDADWNGASSVAQKFFACGGSTLRKQCGANALSYRPQRSCGVDGACALKFAGTCKNPNIKAGNACKTIKSTGYSDCHVEVSNASGYFPSGSEPFKEVITVYLRPKEFNQLYQGCSPL